MQKRTPTRRQTLIYSSGSTWAAVFQYCQGWETQPSGEKIFILLELVFDSWETEETSLVIIPCIVLGDLHNLDCYKPSYKNYP